MPRTNQAARAAHLRRGHFYLPKHLYARSCERVRLADLDELLRYLALFRRRYYLDGPNDFDWILRNEITQEREGAIDVDLVSLEGRLEWASPSSWELLDWADLPVRGEQVVKSLTAIGAATPKGLAVTAEVWRDFAPTAATTFHELSGRIASFFSALVDQGVTPSISDHDAGVLVDSWQYPRTAQI